MYKKWLSEMVFWVVTALLAVTDPFTSPAGDGSASAQISPGEWVWLVVGFLGAVQVVVVPNLNAGVAKYAKLIVHGSLAVAGLGLSWALDGISVNDVLTLIMAFMAGAGIWRFPSVPHQYVPGEVVEVRPTAA